MLSIEEIKLLIEKLEKAKASDLKQLIQTSIDDLKRIREYIERTDRDTGSFVKKGASFYRHDLQEKKNFKQDEILYLAVKEKIWHFAKTNLYNSLEIGPGNAQFSTLFPAWRQQFYVDVLKETEKKVRYKFNDFHQKYIKFFLTDSFSCGDVPKNSVNFVFSWDTFVFFTEEQIDQYLSSIAQVLIPGGYAMLHYADCHYEHDLEMSKKGYWAYNNKAIMTSLLEKHGYAILEMDQFKPGHNYTIFKKPGNENPIVYKISEIVLD
tara:strand:+ start:476 stop:1270 length:795 start_codon:yes stop_codon:yes gene_type:complete